ncbi:MAG TPA: hypothetical protein VI911_00055 [Patescibacteria group bacterium]|nr:hypothetical protein [Patescibacteria group bacterium]
MERDKLIIEKNKKHEELIEWLETECQSPETADLSHSFAENLMIKLAEISYIENELSALEKEAPEVYASQRSELTDEYIEKEAEIEIPLSSSSTLNVQRMRWIQGCKWARDRQKGYSGEFIEWIAFDGLEMFPMTGKDGDGKIRWFDLQDGENPLEDVYGYWLTEIKDK